MGAASHTLATHSTAYLGWAAGCGRKTGNKGKLLSDITIAAVIPLYNGAEFIRETLESVLAQVRPADEIIVVDDGSTDNGAAIVEEMASHSPITLLRKANGGQSSARNHAIKHSRCSHIAFLDQDDTWYEQHLELLAEPFVAGKIRDLGIVYGNLDHVDRAGRMILRSCLDDIPTSHPKRSLLECLRYDMFILPGATLASRSAMMAAGLFDERLSGYEDDDLFLRIFSLGFRSIYIKTPVTRWRIYSGSTSFSMRMAKSRMIYFQKLLAGYPDDADLGLYWSRDVIAPRFVRTLTDEYMRASRSGRQDLMRQLVADMGTVLPALKPSQRLKIQVARPVIDLLGATPFSGLGRNLLRRATR